MPWIFISEHLILKPIDDFTVTISLARFPNIVGEFSFTEEAIISHFKANRYKFENNNFQIQPWKVDYSKYNIKKSFTLPTQLKCFWGENEEEYLYLDLEKVLGYTVK